MIAWGVDQARLFLTAMLFFTRVPIRVGAYGPERLAEANRYLPLVGLWVGGVCAGIYVAALQVWPPSLAIALSMVAGLLVTGAFHEDGLADTADGFGGGWDAEQILRIMKDSRIGAFGACALVAALGLKYCCLAALDPTAVPVALLIGHSASRALAVSLMGPLPYCRADDASAKAADATGRLAWGSLLTAALWPLAALALLWPVWPAMIAVVLMLLVLRWWLLAWFRRRLGGYTGDCLGAAQQLAELGCYLVLTMRWWAAG